MLGCGYVGLTTGACLAHFGHDVVCADVEPGRISLLQGGELPFVEPDLAGLVSESQAAGRLRFVLGAAEAVADREFAVVCVPTPRGPGDAPDLTFVRRCVAEVAPALTKAAIMIVKSTVPVGTTAEVERWLGRSDVAVVSNPEFLREGSAVHDCLHPDRIVVGCDDRGAAHRVAQLYDGCAAPVVITDPRTAEVLKYTANAFLATRLSFINAISTVCDVLGADMDGVVAGLGYDRRIGPEFLQPGPGWGGSCLPKDTRALLRMAGDAGLRFELLEQVIETNDRQIDSVIGKIRVAAGGTLRGAVVAVLGLAFKANTDDLRDSPAIIIIERIVGEGAIVRAYDPTAREAAGTYELATTPYEAAESADVVAVLTEWEEFRDLDLDKLAAVMRGNAVVDARNMLDKAAFVAAGYDYTGLGR